MIRIALVDDHDLLRAGVRAILEKDPQFQIVGETGDGQDAIRRIAEWKPDIVLMDVHLPGGIGVLDELVDLVTAGRSIEDAEDDYDRLSTREKQVFKLVAEGKTSRDIAKYLGISLKTAMTHRTHIMEKLAMHSRSEIMRYAIRKAIIPPEEV